MELSSEEVYDSGSSAASVYSSLPEPGDGAPSGVAAAQYEVLSLEAVAAAQAEAVAGVAAVWQLSSHAARTLLMHFRYDADAVAAALVEDPERAHREAGVSGGDHAPRHADAVAQCGTCFSHGELLRMEACGHAFCVECWAAHFAVRVADGGARRIACMEFRCGAAVPAETIDAVLKAENGSEGAAAQYARSMLESYVEDNANVRWCPSVPHCGNAVRVGGDKLVEVRCACGQAFCFACCEAPHSPATCEMWRKWKAKANDDSETNNWITANTKPCPKCGKSVEKNGGCNLVSCTCGQCFCWLCGTKTGRDHTWTTIEGHSCGRFKEEAEERSEAAASVLRRYLHYHSRWKSHLESSTLESKQSESLEEKVRQLEEDGGSQLVDFSWLTSGLEMLFVARRLLANSYVFAFYVFGNDMFREEVGEEQNGINQRLFEDYQASLEETVEKLSKAIETPPELVDADLRVGVLNLTALLDTKCFRMCRAVEDDLLGSLQCSSQHIAAYVPRSTTRTECGGGFGGGGAPAGSPSSRKRGRGEAQ